jgi:hypothetical protein
MPNRLKTVQAHLRRRALEVFTDSGFAAYVIFCNDHGLALE